MSTTDHTPAPTAEEVADALDWLSRSFRTDDLDRHYRETAEQVEVLRAALAAAPAEPSVAPGRPNLAVHVHLRDGSTRAIPYDCNIESPFQALERVYRHGDEHGPDFMVWDATHVTFSDGAVGRSVSPDDAHAETVTEWRIAGTGSDGQPVYATPNPSVEAALAWYGTHWRNVHLQSRTVTTSRRESEWKATDQ